MINIKKKNTYILVVNLKHNLFSNVSETVMQEQQK